MDCTGLALKGSKSSPYYLKMKEALQRDMDKVLGTDGVLLYPSHPLLAPKHHHPLFTVYNFSYTGNTTWGIHLNQESYSSFSHIHDSSIVPYLFAGIFNALALPVTQCPLGLSEEGLPLGVQVVGGKLQDRLTLAVALYLEKAFGGWRNPGTSWGTGPHGAGGPMLPSLTMINKYITNLIFLVFTRVIKSVWVLQN